jgi:integrase
VKTTDITSRSIGQYAEARRQAIKGTTVNKELACIRHMTKKAEEWGYALENPARRVKDLPDDGNIHERYLTPEEYLALRAEARRGLDQKWTLPGERFEDCEELIDIACFTGLRKAELLHLEFTDIDGRILHVKKKPHLGFHVKNYQERQVPLVPQALAAIEQLRSRKHPASNFLFHRGNGAKWTDFVATFESAVERCGLKAPGPRNVTLHTLRHTFGSWLAIAGIRCGPFKS